MIEMCVDRHIPEVHFNELLILKLLLSQSVTLRKHKHCLASDGGSKRNLRSIYRGSDNTVWLDYST